MTECTAEGDKAYEKVVRYIKDSIIGGELKIGSKLPPERNIAEELGLSRNSVREGIHMLKIMGFVSSQQGAGNYVVCDLDENITESLSIMKDGNLDRKALAAIVFSDKEKRKVLNDITHGDRP